MDVILVGPLPTPALPMLIKSLRADMGVMITASHNTYEYNGLKFFDSNGLKIIKSLENIKDVSEKSLFVEEESCSNIPVPKSSKERGIDIHSKIEKFFKVSEAEKESLLKKFPFISYFFEELYSQALSIYCF